MINRSIILIENYKSLKADAWYKRIISRLSESDHELAISFFTANGGLNNDELEMKINRLFLDMKDKPKRWKEIAELLSATNTKSRL